MACLTLPTPSFDECNPNFLNGQIGEIFITNIGNPLTDVGDATEWATRIAATDETSIKTLKVRGDKPAVTPSVVERASGLKSTAESPQILNFTIDDLSDENYAVMLFVQEHPNLLYWYKDRTSNTAVPLGYIYGGNSGTKGYMYFSEVIPAEKTDGQTFSGSAQWDSVTSPERSVSVI